MKLILEGWRHFINEELYYQDPVSGELRGPEPDIKKVSDDIIKFIKRKFDHLYGDSELALKGGKYVLRFTNFGSLKDRDEVIRSLAAAGWLSDLEVKRSQLFHRATTNFLDKTVKKDGTEKITPIVVQFDAGGGAATSGGDYEKEMENLLNDRFASLGRPQYTAEKQGGSTNNPDVVVFKGDAPYLSFEAKTKPNADFGQFQIVHNPARGSFAQKTQTSSEQLVGVFKLIKDQINKSCSTTYDPQKSGDLLSVDMGNLGEIVEKYYQEKGVDFIIVNDMLYSSSDKGAKIVPGAKRFKDAATNGYVRIRVKCHGKSYSTTGALKFKAIEPSILYYDSTPMNQMFP